MKCLASLRELVRRSRHFVIVLTIILPFIYVISRRQLRMMQNNSTNNNPNRTNLIEFEAVNNMKMDFFDGELEEPSFSQFKKAVLMIQLQGFGLGNQLFLYAQSYALSRNLRLPLVIPVSAKSHDKHNLNDFTNREFLLDKFSLPKGMFLEGKDVQKLNPVYTVNCETIGNSSLIPEAILKNTSYYEILLICLEDTIFKKYEEEIQQIKVKLSSSPSESYLKWKDFISSTEWPIAVHVRRGDLKKLYWSPSYQYFRDALKRMEKEVPAGVKKRVFVFSDDIQSTKENLVGEGFFPAELGLHMYFVSGSYGGLTNLEELDLMIRCKSIVISNSSFSWWAAYLMKNTAGEHKKIVIRPQFNVTKHRNDSIDSKRRVYALKYPREWISIDA